MAHIQRGKNNYFGFLPVIDAGSNVPSNVYAVSSSEANPIGIGDVCVFTSMGTVKRATGASVASMAGVAGSFVIAGGGSTAALLNTQTSQNVLLYDSPHTQFVGCDSSSGLIGTTGLMKMAAILTTGVVGSTGPSLTGRSVMALGALTTAAQSGAFKIVKLHPVEAGYSTDAPGTGAGIQVRKWILQPAFAANAGYSEAVTT